MGMSGQIHAPAALTPGKIPAVRTEEEVEWASELVLELWDILDAVTKGLGRVMAVAVRRWFMPDQSMSNLSSTKWHCDTFWS